MKFLSLVWGNLKRRKLRTALTILSVFVAFVLYGLLCTIKEAFTGQIALAGVDRLIVRHKVSLIMLLPEAYKARMERIPGVASAVHLTWFRRSDFERCVSNNGNSTFRSAVNTGMRL